MSKWGGWMLEKQKNYRCEHETERLEMDGRIRTFEALMW